jgi:hypothetical protein
MTANRGQFVDLEVEHERPDAEEEGRDGTGEWRLRGDPTAGRTQAGGPLVVAVAGEGDRRADADDRREQRRRGEEADAKRRTRSGEGRGENEMGARVPGRGGAPAAYIAAVPRLIQRLGGADPTDRRKPGRGTGGESCQAGPTTCLMPGRLWAALYQAVPRAGPTGRGGGPGTKRPSGRAGTRHYRSGLGSG